MDYQDTKIVDKIKEFLDVDYDSLKVNLTSLLDSHEKQAKRLETILKQSDKRELRLIELNEELDKYKNELEKKVEEEIAKRLEQEVLLQQQAKLAAMGEMMDAVAHQWAQPLNILHGRAQILEMDFEDGLIDKSYIDGFKKSLVGQVDHLVSTLAEFRSFFRPNKEKDSFSIRQVIDKVLLLVNDEFMMNAITVKVNAEEDVFMLGIENEFKHIVLNIINNAKDAFIDNDVKERIININIGKDGKRVQVEFVDNAGGIPEGVIDNIFKANVTTKERGTGIGLYMSAQIAQKSNGVLTAENVDGGAKLTFST